VNNMRELIRVRREAADRDVSFAYPISVTIGDSEEPTEIEDAEAYARLISSCQD
jgi:hypothetical protein